MTTIQNNTSSSEFKSSRHMEDFTHMRRTVTVSCKSMPADPISPPRFDINYRFSFQTIDTSWIIPSDSDIWQFCGRHISTMTDRFVSLHIEHFADYPETCEILNKLLGDWPVLDSTREVAVDYVWTTTRSNIRFLCKRRDTGIIIVHLHFHLATLVTNVFEEGEPPCVDMIPAAGLSIEFLERKAVEGGGDCSICLDDLHEGLCMPCCHVFHGVCIVTWLRFSHYCPLCRLEMPIAI